MGKHNKILDVTYGSFSCRLEGFDDSVKTLKAVVSYFQEIGGIDNFVSDAPKTPDLETLARLARDHADGSVDVETDGAHLSLRFHRNEPAKTPQEDIAEDSDDQAVEDFDAEPEQDVAEVEDIDTNEPWAAMQEADPFKAETLETDDLDIDDSDMDADLDDAEAEDENLFADLRAMTTDDDAADEIADDVAMTDDEAAEPDDLVSDDFTVAEDDDAAEDMTMTEDAAQPVDQISDGFTVAEDVVEEIDDLDEPAMGAEPVAPQTPPAQGNTPARHAEQQASVADKLQRIRAVVGRGRVTETDDTYAEDISDSRPAVAPAAANPLAQRLAELAKRNSEVPQATTPQPPTDDPAPLHLGDSERIDEDETPTDAADASSAPDAQTDGDEWAGYADDAADEQTDDEPAEIRSDAASGRYDELRDALKAYAADDLTEEQEPAEEAEDNRSFDEPAMDADDQDADVAATDETDVDDDEADDVATYDADADETDADESEDTAPSAAQSRPLLLTPKGAAVSEDDDEDFDLHEEVAELARELASRPGNELARHGLPRSVEDAMSRILMETNQHLDQPESQRHRDAFAQLKAAVAATEAARQLGDTTKSRDIGAMYRDDFGALEAAENAKNPRGPSLKLVTDDDATDQRATDAASARLREIAAMKEAETSELETENFATFAKAQGADELADLLEAAAAYLSFVEGEDDFSRPQVMKVAQTATETEISREDGLRSFGRLLRQSRIIKLNNGRFQVSDSTRFRPTSSRVARG